MTEHSNEQLRREAHNAYCNWPKRIGNYDFSEEPSRYDCFIAGYLAAATKKEVPVLGAVERSASSAPSGRYSVLADAHRRRIQALGAAISRREWSETEAAHAEIRDAFDRPDIYDPVPAGQGDGASALERVRHVRTGGVYEVLFEGVELQVAVHKRLLDDWALALCEGDRLVVYKGEDGKLWARQENEFRDGRFKTIAPCAVSNAKSPSAAIRDVLAERCRQVEAKGWTPEHDDEHNFGQLAEAAAVYAKGAAEQAVCGSPAGALYGLSWPWCDASLKWKDARSNLVRSGALVLAEIERLDRIAPPAPSNAGGAV